MRQQLVQGLVCWRVKCQMPLLQYGGDTDFLLRVLDFHVPVRGEMILLDSSATLLLQQAGTAYEEQGYVARATRLLAKWQHTKPPCLPAGPLEQSPPVALHIFPRTRDMSGDQTRHRWRQALARTPLGTPGSRLGSLFLVPSAKR